MSWDDIRLAELADVRSGGGAPQNADAFSEDGLPFVRAGSLVKLLSGMGEAELEKIRPEVARSHGLKPFPAGTVLFAKSGMSATKGHIYALRHEAYVVNHLAALVPRRRTDTAFLTQALQRFSPTALIKDPAYPSIRLGDIEEMTIRAPRESRERDRIAAILDHADALRRKRREAIARLEELRRSLFDEMFGNPEANPKNWPLGRIADVAAATQYGTSGKAGEDGEFPILRMGNITFEGGWKLDDLKFIDIPAKDVPKYTVQPGDILFNRTNSPDLVGKTAVFRESKPFAFAGYLVRLRVNNRAHPEFVSAYLNSKHGKTTLRGMCKSIIGMANINAKELTSIPLMLPPFELQRKFGELVKQTLSDEKLHAIHSDQLDALFATLQHRAFRGEL